MGAHDGGVEHLNEMRGSAHGSKRVEKGLEHARLAHAVEAFPDAVPMTKPFRQSTPTHIFDGEEMQRFEEQTVVLGFATATRQARPKNGERMRPVLFVHFRRYDASPPIRLEAYESCQIHCRNPKNVRLADFVHTA